MSRPARFSQVLASGLTAGVIAAATAATAAVFSDTTASSSSGTNAATASEWLAVSFVVDSDYAATGLVATLLMTSSSGAPTLSLYSSYVDTYGGSSNLIPDSPIATFTTGASSSGSAAFSLASVDLTANSTYWLVLSSSGASDWSWTATTGGSGSGHTGRWASSEDDGELGTLWFTQSTLYPLQFSVPEPSRAASSLACIAMLGVLGWSRRTSV